jgi:hypothetical protein
LETERLRDISYASLTEACRVGKGPSSNILINQLRTRINDKKMSLSAGHYRPHYARA